ncbi:MAG: methionyl-tRNA formyltransferase [Eubacteriales bacterium]|nr:methionyl-tRNA formyltransferase [Eubacteriales bacterium]
MRVVFMGTPDFAVGTLEALLNSEHEVAAVFTQPDKPKGRGHAMQFTPVKETAVAAGVPVYQPLKVRETEVIEQVRTLAPEVIVVVAFGQIIPQSILDIPKYGCVNVHASLLPKYRGAAPIQWAVIDGEERSGVTTMQMDAGLDTGDMLLKREVVLAENETGGSLFDKLSMVGAELLLETLTALEKGEVQPQKQPAESPTPYAAMLNKKMGEIDWQRSAVEIERLIRGLNPWPSAYTRLDGKTLKIWEASVMETGEENAVPGTVVSLENGQIVISTGEGRLAVRELQLEGKKRMAADAFLRGYKLQTGTVLSGKA